MGSPKRRLPQRPPPPSERPRFRSAPKDGVGKGTLGRGVGGRREAQPPGDSARTVTSGRRTGHDFASRHRNPITALQSPPNRSAPKSSSKPQVLAISPGAEGLESVTRSRSEGWSHGGSGVPQACKAPSVPLWAPRWHAGTKWRITRHGVSGARGSDSPCGAPGFGPSCSREWQ